jgi:hypothetical protein
MLHGRTWALLAAAGMLSASTLALRGGEPEAGTIHDDFESDRPVWRQEQTDTTVNLLAHERSPLAAHDGQRSERFAFSAGLGSAFYFSYALPKIPVSDELKASLYARSKRAGVRIYGRVILPADTDPDTGQPSFVLVPGTIYENVDRWQRLELMALRPSIERQARVLRASTRRTVSLDGAYLDGLIVNLFGGEGESEVFLDDLTVAPVAPELVAAHALPHPDAPVAPGVHAGNRNAPRAAVGSAQVSFDRNRLRRKGFDWVPTIIQAPGADVAALRSAGFDVLAEDLRADPERIRDAIQRGFLLMPSLAGAPGSPAPEPDEVVEMAASYPYRDAVAFWNLGERLGSSPDLQVRGDEIERIRAIVAGMRRLPGDFSHLTTAIVEGELPFYARAPKNLDILGIRPLMWSAAQNPTDIYRFLEQRRSLTVKSNAGGLFCAWITATPPPIVQSAIWGQDVPPDWGYLRVQPEQIRLNTYLALSAGYRAIGFRADADLTRPFGRALLIEMALLNEEIDLFQSIIAQGSDPYPFEVTYPADPPILPPPGTMNVGARPPQFKEFDPFPGIRVASINTSDRRGSLLLVGDYVGGAQYQPPQSSMNDLKIIVPARESAQAFEITPGGVRALDSQRGIGGRRITVPEFGQTALILFTTDMELVARIEREVKHVAPRAVDLAIEQAELKYQWVKDIIGRLVADDHRLYDPNDPTSPPLTPGTPPPNEEAELLALAEKSIRSAHEAQEREDYQLAWDEARRASRPLRILMFAHWQKAVAAMIKLHVPSTDNSAPKFTRENANRYAEISAPKKKPGTVILPVASPPCVAFSTLPQHFLWVDWMKKTTYSENLIPSGSFDDDESLKEAGWLNQSYQFEGLKVKIGTVENGPAREQKRALRLSVEPAEKVPVDSLPPFLDFPIAAVRSPAVQVRAGQFFRISVWVQRPLLAPPGMGGVIIRDSIGGEQFQFRWHDPIPEFSKVVLYRRAPADGELTVTLGLAGMYDVYFDDFRVEVVQGTPAPSPADVAARPRSRPRSRPSPRPEPVVTPEDAPPPSTAGRPASVPRTSR